MDPFLNNDFTNKNANFGEYTNPIEVNKPEYIYTTSNDIGLETYFTQPYNENNNISYNISYLPGTNEVYNNENNNNSYNISYLPGTNEVYNNEYNNYSYTFSDKIDSEKNKNNNNYYNKLLSKENILNTNYNNYGNIENTVNSNISNFANVKPISKKDENINYTYYDNNSELLKPSTNVNYYTDNITDFYTGLNTNNIESIPNLVLSNTNNINNINLNENNYYVLNNNSNINYNYIPTSNDSSHIAYNNNLSNNKISNKNIVVKNNKKYYKNAPQIKINEIEINSKGLNKISSDYILNIISNFIKDDIKYKLFVHSKKFQKKLGLSLNGYQEKGIKKTGIKLCNYLSGFNYEKFGPHEYYNSIIKRYINKYDYDFRKDSLKREFLYHLDILKIKYIKSYIVYYFKKYKENKKDDSNLYLDIFCPFFELLSNQEYFAELFTIPIDTKFIETNKMENEYISAFNKLNNSKQNYSILFKYRKESDFNFFNKCVNLQKVRKLTFFEKQTEIEKHPRNEIIGISENGLPYIESIKFLCDPGKLLEEKIYRLFKTISGVRELFTNLLYLRISITPYGFHKKKYYLIDNINNFKSLQYLELDYFSFTDQMFELKINNLKTFKIVYCRGIIISDNCCLNLKELHIIKSDISYINSPLKFPNLEKCIFYLYLKDNNIKTSYNYMARLNASIDFSSFKNIKVLNVEADDFLKLKNNTLESLSLVSNDNDNNKEKEKKIFEKIISMKSLKEVKISLKIINDNDISEIQGENPSVEKLEIFWDKTIPDCTLINLQKKFPNVSSFSLTNPPINLFDTNLKIEKNINCKINKLVLYGGCSNIKLYCLPLENLVEFELVMFIDKEDGIKGSLPFLSKNCPLTFKSLRSFKFKVCKLEYELLNNICDNLEKMPNLQTLELKSYTPVDQIFYDKLKKKISLLKLNDINIMIYISTSDLSLMHIKDKIINAMIPAGIIIRK